MSSVTLKNCADEPIHVPGAVQAHGHLLVIDPHSFKIIGASQNVKDYLELDPKGVIGSQLSDLFGKDLEEQIKSSVDSNSLEKINPVEVKKNGRVFEGAAHLQDGKLLLECSPVENSKHSFKDIYREMNLANSELTKARDLSSLYSTCAKHVKEISGYSRVMIYRFDEDWNGKVIAEEKEEDLEPFLGLNYPASDIPAQARALYETNWMRVIPKTDYVPSPIVGEFERPLDLSGSSLRSVSQMHVQYLKNMGVMASMSISIIKEGKLWGLIACHDSVPGYLNYEKRQALIFIGQYFSSLIGSREKVENAQYREELRSRQEALFEQMQKRKNFVDGLIEGEESFVDLVKGASGAAIVKDDKIMLFGETPSEKEVLDLARWIDLRMDKGEIFFTTSLSELYENGEQIKDLASGVLNIRIPEEKTFHIMWFKPEVVQTVEWGGDPNKAMNQTGEGVLSPRNSFELWKERVEKASLPFSPEELEVVDALRRSVIEVDLVRQVRSVMESNEELEQFAHVISHDLKEPLRGIKHFSSFLQEDIGKSLNEESKINLKDIQDLSEKAISLISELYEYSKVGQTDFSYKDCDPSELAKSCAQKLKALMKNENATLEIAENMPKVHCDSLRTEEVFYNLISNAIKYNEKEKKVVQVFCKNGPETPVFVVRDNGIGINKNDLSRIFNVFERLHPKESFGGGSGSGLAIVKRIIERHGGDIWVESKLGEGTSFYFTLAPRKRKRDE